MKIEEIHPGLMIVLKKSLPDTNFLVQRAFRRNWIYSVLEKSGGDFWITDFEYSGVRQQFYSEMICEYFDSLEELAYGAV